MRIQMIWDRDHGQEWEGWYVRFTWDDPHVVRDANVSREGGRYRRNLGRRSQAATIRAAAQWEKIALPRPLRWTTTGRAA